MCSRAGGSFVSIGTCYLEVPGSNPGWAGYLSSWLCIYSDPNCSKGMECTVLSMCTMRSNKYRFWAVISRTLVVIIDAGRPNKVIRNKSRAIVPASGFLLLRYCLNEQKATQSNIH